MNVDEAYKVVLQSIPQLDVETLKRLALSRPPSRGGIIKEVEVPFELDQEAHRELTKRGYCIRGLRCERRRPR
jgi:hypothetical protein